MNYIILSSSVSEILKSDYRKRVEETGYPGNADSFLDDVISFDGVYKLYDRCYNGSEYLLIGKAFHLMMTRDKKVPDWFFARKIEKYESGHDEKYLERLSGTRDLPGIWRAVWFEDSLHGLDPRDIMPMDIFLSGLKASYGEFLEFEGRWKTWDIYNNRLKEYEESRERDSERAVEAVLLENNIFTLHLEGMSDHYEEDENVCVRYSGNDRFEYLGKIDQIRKSDNEIDVICEDFTLVEKYAERKTGRIVSCRIMDFGTRARLARQRKAMKRLFSDGSANKNLKSIISGEFDWSDGDGNNSEIVLDDAVSLFGANVRQAKAYAGAINAPDVFMIQGPPGTGKTTIITELVRYIIGKQKKVLVSSETNIAVDNVLERLSSSKDIVPVRIGREESIDDHCKKYIPEKVAETILNKVREKNDHLDRNGVDENALCDLCNAEWEKKKDIVKKEIDKIEKEIGISFDHHEVNKKIENFEKLAAELNVLYADLKAERKAYYSLKESLSEIVLKKAGIEGRILAIKDDPGTKKKELTSLAADLKETDAKEKEAKKLLSENRFESMAASYRRKTRRYEKLKEELGMLFSPCSSVTARAHEIKLMLRDISVLSDQIQIYESKKQEELLSIHADCSRQRELWNSTSDIREEWVGATKSLKVKEDIEQLYMRNTNAVFATCSGIASDKNGHFADMEYDYCIVDEAAKCNMPDLLIPLTMAKKIILVGDHKQLYPMLETEAVKDEMTEEQLSEIRNHILFKLMYEEYVPDKYKVMLDRQYRMVPAISDFVSENFYDGNLICEREDGESPSMIWIDVERSEEKNRGKSFYNPNEADAVVSLLKQLDKNYPGKTEICVICTYKAQAAYIGSLIKNIKWMNIVPECSTVDAFQGKEKHTVIFNTVRSVKISSFVRDENRVNVAVSRAREVLYVVGNASLMKQAHSGVLNYLYDHIRTNGEIRNAEFMR